MNYLSTTPSTHSFYYYPSVPHHHHHPTPIISFLLKTSSHVLMLPLGIWYSPILVSSSILCKRDHSLYFFSIWTDLIHHATIQISLNGRKYCDFIFSYSWVAFHCYMCHTFLIQSPDLGHLDYFQIWVIMNSAPINVKVYMSLNSFWTIEVDAQRWWLHFTRWF